MEIGKEKLLGMFERMLLMRAFENRVRVEFGKGKLPGFVRLDAGEEAAAVGVCAHLTERDFIASTRRALEAAAGELKKQGKSAEVIDPRTLSPLDEETILGSVKKTGRLVVDESHPRCSLATDIAALAADRAFDFLNAPIKTVTAPHTPVPFGPVLEDFYLPSSKKLVAAVAELF